MASEARLDVASLNEPVALQGGSVAWPACEELGHNHGDVREVVVHLHIVAFVRVAQDGANG